ncbi:lipase-like protein [Angomonas deanei]|nr:lipase-like protein [Angomonas deanei]|eukprot:EPY33394.1 lipase-like protein [Angomonas deanei]
MLRKGFRLLERKAPLPKPALRPSGMLADKRRVTEWVLDKIEAPSLYLADALRTVVRYGIVLGTSAFSLVSDCYRLYLSESLRRLIRFAIGIPLFFGSLFLIIMRLWYFPDSNETRRLDTDCVKHFPLVEDTEGMVNMALALRKEYLSYRAAPSPGTPLTVLSGTHRNTILRGIFILFRSMEEHISGTELEREFLTPSALSADVSPAEFVLRIILSISIEQGWFDVVDHTLDLFKDFVWYRQPPLQARVVRAVADLCNISYLLDNVYDHQDASDMLTVAERRSIARAVDAFRPEKAVQERFTIPAEIRVLPLVDGDKTARCLLLERKSPGRRPQLIVCFIGTNSSKNWITNFKFSTLPFPEKYGVKGARAHKGFLELLESVPYAEVTRSFDHIILVGHSLGGALAQLAGLHLAAERPERRITVVTMASPRVLIVNRKEYFASLFQSLFLGIDMPSTTSTSKDDYMAGFVTLPNNYRHFRGFFPFRRDTAPTTREHWLHAHWTPHPVADRLLQLF